MRSKRGRTCVLTFIALALIFELFWAFVIGPDLNEQRASARWPTVQGTVTAARAVQQPEGGTFVPAIEYAYEVAGTQHRGTRYRVVLNPGSRSWADGVVVAHPPGSAVTVYYDPRDPARAVLSPGAGLEPWFAVVFRTVTWGGAALGWAALILKRRSRHHPVA